MIHSLTLDFTSLNTWRSCPQKFAYQIIQSLGRQGAESPALTFGKLIHTGIEYINKYQVVPTDTMYDEAERLSSGGDITITGQKTIEQVLARVAHEASETALYHVLPDERRSLRHCLMLLCRYVERWHPDPLRTEHTEKRHTIYLGQTSSGINIFYGGTIDGLCKGKILERKTTSYLDSGFVNFIHPNAQAAGYVMLARDLYKDDSLNTVIFDALSTSGYGRSKDAKTCNKAAWNINKNPAALFARYETYRTDAQLDEWRDDVLRDAERMAQDIVLGRFSKYDPKPCTEFNSTCSFINLCRASPETRSERINLLTQVALWDGFAINRDRIDEEDPALSGSE